MAAGDDSRLADPRTPTAHALSHALGESDAVSLDHTQISGLGGAALLGVGTTTGTVAAGDDSRILTAASIPPLVGEPTGVDPATPSTLSFTYGSPTSTVTLAPTGASVDIWVAGTKHTLTGPQAVNFTTADGLWFISYTAAGWVASQDVWSIDEDTAQVAMVYVNTTKGAGLLMDERHGVAMDWATHLRMHTVDGAQVSGGAAIADYNVFATAGLNPSVGDNTFSLASATLRDEDLNHTCPAIADGGPYFLARRTGAGTQWTWDTARTVTDGVENSTTTLTSATAVFSAADVGRTVVGDGIPANTTIATYTNPTTVVLSQAATKTQSGVTITIGGPRLPFFTASAVPGATYAQYNQYTGGAWQLTAIANNQWCNYYIFATNYIDPAVAGYVIIPGQAVYTSLAAAQAESVLGLDLAGFPSAEFAPVWQVTLIGSSNANFNDMPGRCAISATAVRLVGYKTSVASAIAPSSHAALSHRDDADSHPASAITNTAAGNIAATDVQSAINELDTEKVPVAGTYAATTTDAVTFKVTGDAANRFVANANGTLEWGDGTNAADVNLYRSGTSTLKTDTGWVVGGACNVAGLLSAQGSTGLSVSHVNGYIYTGGKASGDTPVFLTDVSGDAANRWVLFTDGKQEWGDGANVRDVNLYRGGTNLLRTDDTFQAAALTVGSAKILSGTGAPENAVTAPVGSLWLRTDGGASTTLYVKESGTGNTGWVGK